MSIDFITLAPTVMQVLKAGDANPKSKAHCLWTSYL